MSTQKKKAKTAGSVVRDMKPRKDAKGGLVPAVGPAKSINFTKSRQSTDQDFHKGRQ